ITNTTVGAAACVIKREITAADTSTLAGALSYDHGASANQGITFTNATDVTGTGSVTNLVNTAFNITNTTVGAAAGVTYSAFTAEIGRASCRAGGYDQGVAGNQGITFASATDVTEMG